MHSQVYIQLLLLCTMCLPKQLTLGKITNFLKLLLFENSVRAIYYNISFKKFATRRKWNLTKIKSIFTYYATVWNKIEFASRFRRKHKNKMLTVILFVLLLILIGFAIAMTVLCKLLNLRLFYFKSVQYFTTLWFSPSLLKRKLMLVGNSIHFLSISTLDLARFYNSVTLTMTCICKIFLCFTTTAYSFSVSVYFCMNSIYFTRPKYTSIISRCEAETA